jgi:hypothetical protein
MTANEKRASYYYTHIIICHCRSWSTIEGWLMWGISNMFAWVGSCATKSLPHSLPNYTLTRASTTWTHTQILTLTHTHTHTHIPHTITHTHTHTVTGSHTKPTVHTDTLTLGQRGYGKINKHGHLGREPTFSSLNLKKDLRKLHMYSY